MDENVNKTAQIRELNDRFRREGTMSGVPGRVIVTSGVEALPADDKVRIIEHVCSFDAFCQGDDPYGEHDFGAFDYQDQKFFWKIDYYGDADLTTGSDDPSDPSRSMRVLTIMLSEEY